MVSQSHTAASLHLASHTTCLKNGLLAWSARELRGAGAAVSALHQSLPSPVGLEWGAEAGRTSLQHQSAWLQQGESRRSASLLISPLSGCYYSFLFSCCPRYLCFQGGFPLHSSSFPTWNAAHSKRCYTFYGGPGPCGSALFLKVCLLESDGFYDVL